MTTAEVFQYLPFFRIFIRLKRKSAPESAPPLPKKNIRLAIIAESLSLLLLYLLLSPAIAMPLYNRIIFHPIPENDNLDDQLYFRLIDKNHFRIFEIYGFQSGSVSSRDHQFSQRSAILQNRLDLGWRRRCLL